MTNDSGRTCALEECDRPVYAREWCRSHYRAWRKYGTPVKPKKICSLETCDNLIKHGGSVTFTTVSY